MTNLLLIRHATNDWVSDRLAGWTPGVHLNEEGRAQAAALAERLTGWRFDALYSSPLERALETAEPLATRHGLEVAILEGVGEARYGDWQGQSIKELAKTPEWMRVQFNPSGARFPNGESFPEIQARVVAAIEQVREAHPKGVVAVFAHADIIKLAAAYYAGIHLDLFQRLVISPASVSWISFTSHGPRLVCLNETGQLKPPKPEEAPPADQEAPARPLSEQSHQPMATA